MTPLDILRAYDPSQRILGDAVSASPLRIEEGDCVGVVLFNLGGPESLDDVEPFLYNLLMDPLFLDLPVKGRLRHWLAKSLARFRGDRLRERYEMIGGGSPLTRLAKEQATSLQGHLNDCYGESAGVHFRVYPTMRYGRPSGDETAAKMDADGVDRVVLLPSYPQYSTPTTGSALAYWQILGATGERPSWPTTAVPEFAANPKYVQAVSERIDEALQRFPQDVRDDVALVFSAHDTVVRPRSVRGDRYCCQVRSTVEQVMRVRDGDRPWHISFQSMIGPNSWLSPSTPETLGSLAKQGRRSVLVIPISFVTDHVNTSYDLDIEVRETAEEKGIDHFEVTAGLNTHPLLIEAFAEATLAQLALPVDVNQLRMGGDGQSQTYPLRPLSRMPHHNPGGDSPRCPDCGRTRGARQWIGIDSTAEPDGPTERPASHPGEPLTPTPGPRSTEES